MTATKICAGRVLPVSRSLFGADRGECRLQRAVGISAGNGQLNPALPSRFKVSRTVVPALFSSTPRDTRTGGFAIRLGQTRLGPRPSKQWQQHLRLSSYSQIVIIVEVTDCD